MVSLISLSAIFMLSLPVAEATEESYLRTEEAQRQLLIDHAIFPEEGKQHQQLALSLRNQRLLEAQAESRARELQYQLQAAEALHAMRQLSILVTPATLQEEDEQRSNVSFQSDLKRFRLLGIWRRGSALSARLAYGDHIFSVKSDDLLLGEIRVRIHDKRVTLIAEGRTHELSLGLY